MICACICFTFIILVMLLLKEIHYNIQEEEFVMTCIEAYNMCEAYQKEIDAMNKTIDELTEKNCEKNLDNIVKDSE